MVASAPPLSTSQEDYLKQIYLLSEESDAVTTAALAERLDVRPPSVTGMLKKLARHRLVEHVPYKGVRLTPQGRAKAMRLLRLHRLLESFLHEHLGYGWDEVHEEAERLEHVISERFEQRMAEILGNPTHDPHGDPIPSADLTLPCEAEVQPLDDTAPGQMVRVSRVRTQDPDSLNLLSHLGVIPGARVRVLELESEGVRLEIASQRFLIPKSLSKHLRVEVES